MKLYEFVHTYYIDTGIRTQTGAAALRQSKPSRVMVVTTKLSNSKPLLQSVKHGVVDATCAKHNK